MKSSNLPQARWPGQGSDVFPLLIALQYLLGSRRALFFDATMLLDPPHSILCIYHSWYVKDANRRGLATRTAVVSAVAAKTRLPAPTEPSSATSPRGRRASRSAREMSRPFICWSTAWSSSGSSAACFAEGSSITPFDCRIRRVHRLPAVPIPLHPFDLADRHHRNRCPGDRPHRKRVPAAAIEASARTANLAHPPNWGRRPARITRTMLRPRR